MPRTQDPGYERGATASDTLHVWDLAVGNESRLSE